MPTKKPRIQIILEKETYEKFQELCNIDCRTESQLGKFIVTKYIEKYESEHGEIKVEEKPVPKQSISIENNHGVVMGDNGSVNM